MYMMALQSSKSMLLLLLLCVSLTWGDISWASDGLFFCFWLVCSTLQAGYNINGIHPHGVAVT